MLIGSYHSTLHKLMRVRLSDRDYDVKFITLDVKFITTDHNSAKVLSRSVLIGLKSTLDQ